MRFFWNRNRADIDAPQIIVNPQYDAFKQRLVIAYCRHFAHWGSPMAPLLTQSEMLDILSYFSDTDHEVIRQLKPREAMRIAKNSQGYLPRTVEILCDHTGEFQLIINTRSKIAKHTQDGQPKKRHLSKKGGTFKKYKRSWRVDCYPPIPKANLVIYLSPDLLERHWQCEDVERETLLSQRCGEHSSQICVYEMGSRYSALDKHNKLIYKIGCYAENLTMSLVELIVSQNLSDQALDRLRLDILEGVATLHNQDIVHQDLKINNIMVYQDENYQWRAKIIDFGLSASSMNPYCDVSAGGCYQSPEIAFFYSDKHHLAHWQFFHFTYADAFGNQFTPKGAPIDYRAPHKANDMWALGILFYLMDKKYFPRQMSDIQEPLLKRLLVVDRENRINIQEAIRIQYDLLRPTYPAPKPILNAFDMSDLKAQIEKVWCEPPSRADHKAPSGDLAKLISFF